MTRRRRAIGAVAGALGVAAAGTVAVGVLRQQRRVSRRAGAHVPFGDLRSQPRHVVADDGVVLHVEVDEVEDALAAEGAGVPRGPVDRLLRRGRGSALPVTVVFVHGFCLQLDCWHFQRAAYRGLVRTVYYDQRSHGRSGRSAREHATIDQLGRDLAAVIEATVPEGPVVLVGHSMGGMTIVALAEQFPELIGERVVGVGLVSTTAGGLDPGRLLVPLLPARLSGPFASRAVRALHHGHRGVDVLRRLGGVLANAATAQVAFGSAVPREYVEFVDRMLAATPFEVVADFFPTFGDLDKFDHVARLADVPTSIVCGTADRITSIGHSRKLHARIPGSRLLECEDAGHLVIMERHDLVNAELDQLITAAAQRAGRR